MISVCIPVYNRDVRPLVRTLAAQSAEVADGVELVCIDDASDAAFRALNAEVAPSATLVQLEHNVGRARIRNLFLQHTHGDYMLFLDNDSIVPTGFLKAYAALLPGGPQVVVGGRIYDRHSDDREHHLRYLYGTTAESRAAAQRASQPYRSFMTCNFMIRREVLQRIPFDERLGRYGHEDTLFGFRLQQQGVPVMHVDNPVVNGDVEDNAEFVRKTREGIASLSQIYMFMCGDERFCRSVRLLTAYRHLQRRRLQGAAYGVFRMLRPQLESHFLSGEAISIRQFNFYKLGCFIGIQRNKCNQ